MQSSVTSTVSDPEEFQAALSADGSIRALLTGSGRFWVRSTEVRLTHLRLVSLQENLPRIAFIQVPPGLILIGLSIQCARSPTWGGIRVDNGDLITLGSGSSAHMRSEGPCHWGAIWLPVHLFTRYGHALTGTIPDALPWLCHWCPPANAGNEFRSLYLAAIRTARAASDPTTGPEAAHGLEQQLIYLLIECLSARAATKAPGTTPRRLDVMARFEELIRTHPESNLGMTRISTALGVSQRFLRKCCEDHLGMSPAAYVSLHRMQMANHALRQASPQTARVADIADRLGFRNVARFSVAYRNLYDEMPCETLRRGSRRGVQDVALRHNSVNRGSHDSS